MIKIFLIFLAFLSSCWSLNHKTCTTPYSRCNLGKPGYLNVHLVPHTHDDVGWLKTVDQYYYGSNNHYQRASVQYILDNVITELEKDPNRRFMYVEMAFFSRWWSEQNNSTKQLVRTLVDQGRLEFVIGAWCMNDEATTYYSDIIDQQTLGLKFILEEFGECARPRSAWQIDPFGHSREQASLFAQFGFDGLFLGRIDYQDSDYRSQTKTREMLWQASNNLGDKARIFTGILPNRYSPPPGFCFDAYCKDDPIMDDPNLEDYNVDQKVSDFIQYTYDQAKIYKTNNLIMTMGNDFQYSNAHMWFKNLDKLIYYVNKQQELNGSNVNIFYSTTGCYLYSLNKENTTWQVKYDDFLPYAHRPHSFWTGYFTSRSSLKYYIRKASNVLKNFRQLSFLFVGENDLVEQIPYLERALAVAQHHDAVSGTEKQHVAFDYAKQIADGINRVVAAFNNITKIKYGLNDDDNFFYCSLLNITECLEIENKTTILVAIFNPLASFVQSIIRIPVVSNNYLVFGNESFIDIDYSPVNNETKLIPERKSKANYNLIWKYEAGPLGYNLYTISSLPYASKLSNNLSSKNKQISILKDSANSIVLKNEFLKLTFDTNGYLNQIDNLKSLITTPLKQTFCIYNSMPGNNSNPEFQASGAYIFRPLTNSCNPVPIKNFSLSEGSLYAEIHQVYNDWISSTIRLYNDIKNVEFEWQVGPIDVDDNIGKEIVIKFQTDLDSKSYFYTDSNGREILRRKRDFRPTWNFNQTESVSGNYYPINSRIFIRDESSILRKKKSNDLLRQLTLVTDRSHGGSSITDGSLEIMLHRRTLYDDSLGVSEALNEKGSDGKGLIVKGTLNLIFDTVNNSARLHRQLSLEKNNQPLILLYPTDEKTFFNKTNRLKLPVQTLYNEALAPNLHLLTMINESITNNYLILVRIEHFYERDEDNEFSKPVTLDLRAYFNLNDDVMIEELALGANMNVKELENRLKWYSDSDIENFKIEKERYYKFKSKENRQQYNITFNPMEIRTFRFSSSSPFTPFKI